jgi:hypothetical protein
MSEHKFGPGEYRTREGGEAFIYERFPDSLYGRIKNAGEDYWSVATWHEDGRWRFGIHPHDKDLLPPEPSIVVSDEAVDAYINAWRQTHMGVSGFDDTRAGLAAAFVVMAKDNTK